MDVRRERVAGILFLVGVGLHRTHSNTYRVNDVGHDIYTDFNVLVGIRFVIDF